MKTVPPPNAPPCAVTPYQLPSSPRMGGAGGLAPLVPPNKTKVVISPLDLSLKRLPYPNPSPVSLDPVSPAIESTFPNGPPKAVAP